MRIRIFYLRRSGGTSTSSLIRVLCVIFKNYCVWDKTLWPLPLWRNEARAEIVQGEKDHSTYRSGNFPGFYLYRPSSQFRHAFISHPPRRKKRALLSMTSPPTRSFSHVPSCVRPILPHRFYCWSTSNYRPRTEDRRISPWARVSTPPPIPPRCTPLAVCQIFSVPQRTPFPN